MSPRAEEQVPVSELEPALEDLRKEVAENPHATPQGLIRFSEVLYLKQVEAEKSEEKAKEFFLELQDCALNKTGRESRNVEALCLLTAKNLKKKYASLNRSVEALESRVNPETARLTRLVPN